MKRITALLLTVALLATMVLGCAGKKDETPMGEEQSTKMTEAADTQKADDPLAEKIKFSLAIPEVMPEFVKADDAIYQKVKEKLNIEIEPITVTWDDYQDKLKLWAASGELPDMFLIDNAGSPQFKNWIESGIVRAMPDDMSKYPNLSTVFDFPDVQALKVDGKFYFIPRGNYKSRATDQAAQRVMYYRKDWAQKLGLKEPETVEEFTEFVKAMKNGNPDGDGKVITGVVQYQMGNAFLDSLLFPFVPAASATWIKDEDGKSKPAFFTKGTVEAMKYLRKLYDEGLLDKDFAIQKTEDGLQKFANGRAAVAMWQLTGSFDYMNLLGAGLEKTYPGKKAYDMLGVLKPLKSENDGKNYIYMGNSFWSETYIKGDVDDKKADRILRFLDYTISDEFVEMVRYGLEGVDFKKEGSNYEIIREKDKDGNFVPLRDKYPFLPGNLFAAQWFTDVNMNDPAFYQEVNDEVKNFKDWASTNASFVSPDFNAGFDSNPLKERVKVDGSSLGAEVTKIIVSKEDVETIYNKIVDEYKKRGLDQLIDEVNKAVGN